MLKRPEIREGHVVPNRDLLLGLLLGADYVTWTINGEYYRLRRRQLWAYAWARLDWWMALPDDYRWIPTYDAYETRDGRRLSGRDVHLGRVDPAAWGGRRHPPG